MATMLRTAAGYRSPISFGEGLPPRRSQEATHDYESAPPEPASAARARLKRPNARSAAAKGAMSSGLIADQLRASVTKANQKAVMEQYAVEVDKLLVQLSTMLPYVNTGEWPLRFFYKHLSSIRGASQMLGQTNVASVAGRAEVLVCLLNRHIVSFQATHQELLADSIHIIRSMLRSIRSDGSDRFTNLATQTAASLYAALEPVTQTYEPGRLRDPHAAEERAVLS